MRSRLLQSKVMHARHRAGEERRFSYRVFHALVDLDELEELARRNWLFSARRGWIYSLETRDFLDCGQGTIKENLLHWLRGKKPDIGEVKAVQVLGHLRSFSYNFNPLSVFLVETGNGTECVAEVHNTFGEAKRFLLNPLVDGRSKTRLAKDYYVSPFIEHDCDFEFDLRIFEKGMQLHVCSHRGEDLVLEAHLQGSFEPFTDARLASYLITRPLMPLQVIGAIHWQALRMMLRGIPFYRKQQFSEQQRDYYVSKAFSQHRR